jgi:hypothetical protein
MDGNKQIAYTLNLLRPHQVLGHTKCRIGSAQDGGFVMLKYLRNSHTLFSLGHSQNPEFDAWFADQGCKVILYGDQPPHDKPHHNLTYRAEQLGTGGYQTCFSQLLSDNNLQHAQDLILKCDMRGQEWSCLSRVTSAWYAHFEQMVIEFHDLHNLRDPGFRDWVYQIWEQITRTHVAIHVHARNTSHVNWISGVRVPEVIQVTFVRRDLGICVPSSEQFPTEWDAVCDPSVPDHRLDTFTFI